MYTEVLEQEIAFLRQQNADLQQQLAKSITEFTGKIAQLEHELRESQQLLQSNCQAELALQASQAELLALFNAIQDVILILDAEGRYLKIAPSSAPLLYQPPGELLGKTMHEVLPPAFANLFLNCIQKSLKTKQTIKLEYSLSIANQEVWFEASIAPMSENTVVCLARDISHHKASKAALADNETKYRNLVENISDLIFSMSLDGRFTYVSPQFKNILGWEPSELLGQLFALLLHPDDLLFAQSNIQEMVATKSQRTQIEFRHQRKDGSWCWMRSVTAPIFNSDGEMKGFHGVLSDISGRKQVEAALSQRETQYRSIFETVHDGIIVVDLDTGKIVAANPAFCQMHGYSQAEFLQLSPTDFIHPDSLPQFEEFIDSVKKGLEFHAQAIDIHKNGTYFDVEVTGTLLNYDGKPHALSVVRDISERKRAEQEQRRLLTILEATTDIVGMADAVGNNCYLNKAGQKILGILASEINKFHITEVSISDEFQNEILPTVLREGIWSGESIFRSRNGEEIPVSQVLIAHKNKQGEVEFFSTIARDIRERLQIEAQLRQQAEDLAQTLQELQRTQAQMIQAEKMSSLGQLVAGVAHEINNPVNFIHGNLSYLEEHSRDLLRLINVYQPTKVPEFKALCQEIDLEYIQEDLPKILSSMKVGTQRIRQIVLSLRTFSRMDEAEFKAVDIHESIDSTLMILQHRLKAKPEFPEIQVIQDYGKLPLVECYAGQLNQVFMNILANAIDALEQGRDNEVSLPTITINTTFIDSDWVKVAIADNGVGMSEQVQKQVFNPFFTTKPVGKGTGMGMSISYQIITEKHGGKLECYSKPGEGTEFIITIPIQHLCSGSHTVSP
ncbi:PAS domain S-box protein [Fortiea sp. LEGE XX443]|uniref:PAS domain S-box protein n=1 Tax=Fortiea sp. LEGE XX443 TaxID=1828611 RepID=UPI00187F0638|nr:PAS domain S-box protein [Fortiea sp. LEGE XX443]MBE9004607.1 PAS domain S-box protein [Fortiea sp. LEGE XX443]